MFISKKFQIMNLLYYSIVALGFFLFGIFFCLCVLYKFLTTLLSKFFQWSVILSFYTLFGWFDIKTNEQKTYLLHPLENIFPENSFCKSLDKSECSLLISGNGDPVLDHRLYTYAWSRNSSLELLFFANVSKNKYTSKHTLKFISQWH